MIRYIFISRSYLFVFVYKLLLCVETVITKDIISSYYVIPNKDINNSTHFNDKQKKTKIESNIVGHIVSKKNLIRNKLRSSKRIQNGFKIKNGESVFTAAQVAQQVSATSVWDFGGTWSSELAGVRFVVHSHSTVGIDNSIPVKILDMEVGTKSNGFLNKGWLAKANAHYGPLGPVSLSVINNADKNVAMFIVLIDDAAGIAFALFPRAVYTNLYNSKTTHLNFYLGFVNSQNKNDVITGMWSMGRNCKNNLDTHQSVFNIPDVLYKDSSEQGD